MRRGDEELDLWRGQEKGGVNVMWTIFTSRGSL